MIRRPPRSTLFPTRRSSDLKPFTPFQWEPMISLEETRRKHALLRDELSKLGRGFKDLHVKPRSEEHTSELQSQSNLVCRLLLEKKNKNIHTARIKLSVFLNG